MGGVRRVIRRGVIAATVVFVVAQCAGGPTERELLDEYRPKFDVLREKFGKVAAALPVKGRPVGRCAGLVPKPEYVMSDKVATNTIVLMERHLRDARAELDPASEFDLVHKAHGPVLWAMTEVYRDPSIRDDAEPNEFLITALPAYERIKYLVVGRQINYLRPVGPPPGSKTFTEGSVEMQLFVADLESAKVLCTADLSASSSPGVGLIVGVGQTGQDAVDSDLASRAREAADHALARSGCCGRFKIEHGR